MYEDEKKPDYKGGVALIYLNAAKDGYVPGMNNIRQKVKHMSKCRAQERAKSKLILFD
jgi:hypothetical protein